MKSVKMNPILMAKKTISIVNKGEKTIPETMRIRIETQKIINEANSGYWG